MSIYEKIDRYHEAISAIRPFEGYMLEQLKNYYRIGLTWSSNAIEGNTLTISETKIANRRFTCAPQRVFISTAGLGCPLVPTG